MTTYSLTFDVPSCAEADDARDPVEELLGEQDGERLVEEHVVGETLHGNAPQSLLKH